MAMLQSWESQQRWHAVRIFDPCVLLNPDVIMIGENCRIDSFCKLEGGLGLHIGPFVHVASFVHLNIGGGYLLIGEHAAFASGSRVITGGNRPNGRSMSACSPSDLQVLKSNEVRIGAYAAVLSGAIILPGVTLGEGAVAAAGAVVTKDIPAWEIWAGNPAHFLAKRVVGQLLAPEPGPAPIPDHLAQADADLRAAARGPLTTAQRMSGPSGVNLGYEDGVVR